MDEKEITAWHGAGADIKFEPSDFEIVDLVLGQIPELRICAAALKRARTLKLDFPIAEPKLLATLLQGEKFKGGGHEVGAKDVARYMPLQFFPIRNEGEFVSRIYIALMRAKHEASMKVNTSIDALKNQPISISGKEKS